MTANSISIQTDDAIARGKLKGSQETFFSINISVIVPGLSASDKLDGDVSVGRKIIMHYELVVRRVETTFGQPII